MSLVQTSDTHGDETKQFNRLSQGRPVALQGVDTDLVAFLPRDAWVDTTQALRGATPTAFPEVCRDGEKRKKHQPSLERGVWVAPSTADVGFAVEGVSVLELCFFHCSNDEPMRTEA